MPQFSIFNEFSDFFPQEATGLSDLFVKIDDIFARGDVAAMAEALATMRRSLTLVGDVPEFRNGKEKAKVRSSVIVTRNSLDFHLLV